MSNRTIQPALPRQREYDLLEPPHRPRVDVRRALLEDLPAVRDLIGRQIPGGVAPLETVRNVLIKNRNSIYLFSRGERLIGVYAMLMLTALGLERMLTGELDTKDPDLDCLASRLSTPVALYKWVLVAPGLATEGIMHVSKLLREPKFRYANLFARPQTAAGIHVSEMLGFRPLDCRTPGLYRYVRMVNRRSQMPEAA